MESISRQLKASKASMFMIVGNAECRKWASNLLVVSPTPSAHFECFIVCYTHKSEQQTKNVSGEHINALDVFRPNDLWVLNMFPPDDPSPSTHVIRFFQRTIYFLQPDDFSS